MKPLWRDGDHAALVRDDVFHRKITVDCEDLRAAWIAVFLLHLAELVFDHGEEFTARCRGWQRSSSITAMSREVFFFDLAALQAGQLVQAQLEDGGWSEYLGERILRHEGHLRLVAVLRSADDFDKVVQVIQGDLVAFQDVGAGLGLAQAEGRAAVDDLAAVVDVASEHLFDVHLLGATVVEREEDHAERSFRVGCSCRAG